MTAHRFVRHYFTPVITILDRQNHVESFVEERLDGQSSIATTDGMYVDRRRVGMFVMRLFMFQGTRRRPSSAARSILSGTCIRIPCG